jgi:BarA-like signal transduction histidine kinase
MLNDEEESLNYTSYTHYTVCLLALYGPRKEWCNSVHQNLTLAFSFTSRNLLCELLLPSGHLLKGNRIIKSDYYEACITKTHSRMLMGEGNAKVIKNHKHLDRSTNTYISISHLLRIPWDPA